MGVYNEYCGVQMKIGADLNLIEYNLGDEVDISDGIYIGYEGIVAIQDGKLVAFSKEITDKWGNPIALDEILHDGNPLSRVIEEH